MKFSLSLTLSNIFEPRNEQSESYLKTLWVLKYESDFPLRKMGTLYKICIVCIARLARLGVAKWWSSDWGGESDRWFVENKWYDLRGYSRSIYPVHIHMIYIFYVIIGEVGEPEPHSRPLPQCGKYFELSEGWTCFFLNQMLCYINIYVYCLLFAPLSNLRTKLVIIVE